MENTLVLDNSKYRIKSYLFNLLAVSAIYFVPAISHLLSIPLYLIEPMRIIIILALLHTSKKNAYIIALTLPLFSFLVASHPVLAKSFLVTAELIANIFLFIQISKVVKNNFTSIFLSIILSKSIYYLMKYSFLSLLILTGELISTPIYIQIILTIVLSFYAMFILNRRENSKDLLFN